MYYSSSSNIRHSRIFFCTQRIMYIIYNIKEIPRSIINNLEYEHKLLSIQLGLAEDDHTPFLSEFLGELESFPMPNALIPEIQNLLKKVGRVEDDKPRIDVLLGLRRIISEQLSYIYYCPEHEDCDVYYIHCYNDNITIGGTFVFYNKLYPDRVLMQGIVKSITAALFPSMFPRLNTIVDVAVTALCRRLGVNYIEVHPIGDQGRILVQHYGYNKMWEEQPRVFCECEDTTMSNWVYVKTI